MKKSAAARSAKCAPNTKRGGEDEAAHRLFKDPPVWFALLWLLLTGGMIALSAKVSSSAAQEEPFAPVLYGFTALSLSYSIYAAVKWVPKVKLAAKTRLSRNKIAGTFLASYTVRTVVYSSLSTLFDFAYVVVNGVTAIVYHSVWYYALAAYYFALMVIRLFVILCAGQGLKNTAKRAIRSTNANSTSI